MCAFFHRRGTISWGYQDAQRSKIRSYHKVWRVCGLSEGGNSMSGIREKLETVFLCFIGA